MPHDRPAPECPPLPDLLATSAVRLPGHRPMPADRPTECWLADDLAAPDHLVIPGHPPKPDRPAVAACTRETGPPVAGLPAVTAPPPVPDLPVVADWPSAPDYPAVPHYLSVRDRLPVPDWPPVPVRRPLALLRHPRALLRRLARLAPRNPAADGRAPRRAAVTGYLAVPVFGVPVLIYLATLRGSGWARRHAAQAVNVWFTGLLYDLSAVIMGSMLALGSPSAALIVFGPLVAARWLVTSVYLVRAARAAGCGAAYTFPAWLCMRLAR